MLNIDVVFLHPRTTLRLQPLDAGFISNFKWTYERDQIENAVDLLEESATNVSQKTNVLKTMKVIHEI